MREARKALCLSALTLQIFVSIATAHGGHASSNYSDMGMGGDNPDMSPKDKKLYGMESYWAHHEHAGLMYAHIALMILGWVVVLPIAVMLSIAQSRLTTLAQIIFLAFNGLGVLTSVIYDSRTPDLYVNNSHHKAGWAISWIVLVWVIAGILSLRSRRRGKIHSEYQPITSEALKEHGELENTHSAVTQRWSGDSGQGSERNTASLFGSRTNSWNSDRFPSSKNFANDYEPEDEATETRGFLGAERIGRILGKVIPDKAQHHVISLITFVCLILDRFVILLGFIAIVTGLVTYGGIARDHHIFNILAHFIKGSIFVWYGILTFGRWLGCFADFGWAWNIKPGPEIVGRTKSRVPTAEFTESFVIWLYGASNVFLEHLTAWGSAWSPMDLEHLSITIMFFGGGMLGMLIESKSIRNLLTKTLTSSTYSRLDGAGARWQAPDSYVHPLNPVPALVIMLLGILMSTHTQNSVVSSVIHKQWGTLFSCFALARGVTYLTMWIKPPHTYLASRPPSEVIAAFCLISGGFIFMASNQDTVHALEVYGLMANFVFTIVMAVTSLIMAWMTVTVAVKAWATQRLHKSVSLPKSQTFAA